MTKKLFGITSWGIGCAEGVGIFARVSFYHRWINKIINATEPPEKDNDDPLEYETTNKYGNFEVDDGYARGKSRKNEKEVKKTTKQFFFFHFHSKLSAMILSSHL